MFENSIVSSKTQYAHRWNQRREAIVLSIERSQTEPFHFFGRFPGRGSFAKAGLYQKNPGPVKYGAPKKGRGGLNMERVGGMAARPFNDCSSVVAAWRLLP